MNAIATKPKIETPVPEQQPRPGGWFLFFIAFCGILGVVALWKEVDFLEEDPEGNPILSEERQRKLDKVLREFDEAEQYVLLANQNGYYPCYNCGDSTQIYLYIRQVWRYGSTRKQLKGRYKNSLEAKKLLYVTQYKGTLTECEKREMIKIFKYATLPENTIREKPLIRPPGNKIDH